MAQVDFTATFDTTQVQAALEKITKAVEAGQEEFDALAGASAETFDQMAQGGNKAAQSTARAADQTKILSKELSAAGRNVNVFGVNIGGLINNLSLIRGGFKSFAAVARIAISSVTGALLASGIGALFLIVATAVAGVIAAFKRVKPVSDAVGNAFTALGAVVTVFVERVAGVAQGLRQIFAGDIRAGLGTIGDSFRGIASDARAAAADAIALGKEIEKIANDDADLARRRAIAAEGLVRLKAAQDDETKSIRERQAAARAASETNKAFLNEEIALAGRKLIAANKEAAATAKQRTAADGTLRDTEEQIAAVVQLNNLRADAASLDIEAANAQASLRREAAAAAKARQSELDALNAQIKAFLSQVDQLERSGLQGVSRIRAERDAAEAALTAQEEALRKSFRAAGRKFDLEADFERARVAINDQANMEIRAALAEEEQWLIDQRARKAKAEEDAAAKVVAEQLKNLSTSREILLARAELERLDGLTEVEEAQARARKKLSIELDFTRARQKIIEEQFGVNSLEAQLVREQINLLEREYEMAGDIPLNGLERLKARVLEALNINEQELAVLGQAGQQAIEALTQLVDATVNLQIAQQDKLLRAIRGRIQSTQSALAEEQRRQQAGYANNVAALEESLEAQQAAEIAAERKRAELEEKKTRATVRQNQIQAVSDYGKLVISLLAAEASKGVFGIALAVGGLALIARIIAQQRSLATQSVQGFRDGTPYVDGPGGTRSDRVRANLSVGERVVNARDNADIGGRSLRPGELVEYVNLGKLYKAALGAGDQLPALNRQAEATGARGREAEQGMSRETMEQAYREAAKESAAMVVDAIREQGTVIPLGDRTRVERVGATGRKTDIFMHPKK